MVARRIYFLAISFILCCVCSARLCGQQQNIPRAKQNKIVYEGPVAPLLAQLADKYHVNIGLEVDPLQPNTKIDFWFDTIEDILDGIIQATPQYRWQSDEGFIDVFPAKGRCALLETEVAEFSVENNQWLAASEALTKLPEVARQMNALDLTRRDVDRRRPQVVTFSVSLKKVTLHRALHEITRKSNNTFWMFERYGKDPEFFSISNSAP